METKFNKEQVCELDEKALVNAFEVDELEKRYEMGWIKSLDFEAEMDTDFKGENTCKFGCKAKIF
jgi:hypothetical protein